MVLEFGLFKPDSTLQTADYRTAGSHQSENLKYATGGAINTWYEIYVVPTGKTFYVAGIVISFVGASGTIFLGTGAAASEVEFMAIGVGTVDRLFAFAMPTPIKLSSGTRIAGKTGASVTNYYYSLIGWEE